ncbi:MAG: excisionase [Candidatus Ornithomonoglobus sp.]
MQRVTAENKDLLNPSETIEYFKLSQRKFYALIREMPDNDFIVLYGSRRLIIRTAFEKYILKHPELRRCR